MWGRSQVGCSADSVLCPCETRLELNDKPFFQNLKIQRSVGRARDGTTFPLSLKLKSQPNSEEATTSEVAPVRGYWASIWVFCTISGLITLLPDGTIHGINHSFALTLFGYGKTELLGKVGLPWAPGSPFPPRRPLCSAVQACVWHRPRARQALQVVPLPRRDLGSREGGPCSQLPSSFLSTPPQQPPLEGGRGALCLEALEIWSD